ncbi:MULTISPECIES: uracil-xanthine permease family protein [Arthrobacter]|uniref:NCS2 family nucleobase:cation symporter n=1 Tax=Arthrobacter sunyaminii TaxID=2816859 RepID=A0A975S5S0_9MICC|nr:MULTISPECIES: solute carrier family 23 protein [Arthrobacter]MBO0896850.1 nitrate reductase [Arthrobacter sunyaminii]MBO0909333.1 nitrate reductase [Arthrobacter sunyaminii]QWQ36341.1 NCS2 family nucleobase:cation symporter [Arthrobacter sunyaminii]
MSKFGTAWTIHGDGKTIKPGEYVAPDERLSWPRTIGIGSQHVVAMFGATFLVPLLTGFPPATTLLFSGIGTILFLIITAGRVPSYLGSSFAFIAPITAATSQHGPGGALGGIIMAGAVLFLVGLAVQRAGTKWIQILMPPVVTGTIVALIGLNLAGSARDNFEKGPLTATITVAAILLATVLFRGFLGRLSILFGVVAGYIAAIIQGEVDFQAINDAAWFGLPEFHSPTFHFSLIGLFVPVVLVLVAENIGHVKSVAAMTGRDLDPYAGRALMADGLATVLAGSGGGSATTTYAENIGVMAASRVYSTAAYWVAGIVAILLSLFPKFGAMIATVPGGVLGGAGVILYGMIGILGVRIWVDNRVNFSNPINLSTAGLGLIVAIANFTWVVAGVEFGGIALGTGATLIAFHGMQSIARWRGTDPDEPGEDLGSKPSRLG